MRPHFSTKRFLQNYLPTMGLILLSWYICFHQSNFHRGILTNALPLPWLGEWSAPILQQLSVWFPSLDLPSLNVLTVSFLFKLLIVVYAIALIPFYRKYPWLHAKAYVFCRGLWLGLRRPTPPERPGKHRKTSPKPALSAKTRQAGLAIALKFFFAPLMINWCLGHIHEMLANLGNVVADVNWSMSGRLLFDHSLFMASFQLILFIDTLLFTLGYIIETPRLKNRIVSVEPTFFGWFICLACYPPFNNATSMFIDWNSSDFPRFANDTVHLFLNCGILVLMGIYSWASVALGFRASNLTNRGIVSSGPYRFVRHPAYAAKNTAWFIGALPFVIAGFSHGFREGMYVLLCRGAWMFIYAMRAITEERHLRLANNGYAEYAQKVRYRFIPGII